MSIVSQMLDTTTISRKVRVPKVVSFQAGETDAVPDDFMTPGDRIFTPKKLTCCPAPPRPDGCCVPLMTLQEGGDYKPGIYTPLDLASPLKVPVYRSTIMEYAESTPVVLPDMVETPFYMGARPGPRPLVPSRVNEPAGMVYRESVPGSSGPMKFAYRDQAAYELAQYLHR